jgi:iron-sulfur cluster assembly accessory protein
LRLRRRQRPARSRRCRESITLTDRAAQEVKDIWSSRANPTDVALRIYVAGGGCSGLQYGMALDENVEEGDQFLPGQRRSRRD